MRNITITETYLYEVMRELSRQSEEEEWWNYPDLNITISRHTDTGDWVAEVCYTPNERIPVYMSVSYNDGKGTKIKQGFRTHIITLANQEAVEKFWEAMQEGVTPWNDVLEMGDCLVYDDDLD